MIEFISLLLIIIGIVLVFIPQRWLRKLNTPMIGLLLVSVGTVYIFADGLREAIKTVIELVKGWLA